MSSHISHPDKNTATHLDDMPLESSLGTNLKVQEQTAEGGKVSFHPALESCASGAKSVKMSQKSPNKIKMVQNIVKQSDRHREDIKNTLEKVLHQQVIQDVKHAKFEQTYNIMDFLAQSDNSKSLKLNY